MSTSNRTRNSSRNIIFGILLKTYQIIVPFLMRTAMIYLMGVQYLGLNSLFTSVLQVLNLAELGVGSAMIYSMYKPIVKNDEYRICALLKLYKIYYRVIGSAIAVIGLVLTPFIPDLIKGDVPAGINIYILYLLNLSATVLTYWLFAYKNSLLQAHQRADIISKITLSTNTVQFILQFLMLWLFHNYYYYVIVMLFTQIMTNITTAVVASKMYPSYQPIGSLDKVEVKKINHRIIDLFTSKLGTVILESADTIVISAFLGLTVLAIYQNYFYILSSITAFVAVIFNSVVASIGDSIISETKEKNYQDFKVFTFITCWMAGFCVCCFLNLYQPFMRLWVGDKFMLKDYAVWCLCAYFFVQQINKLFNTYKDAAGIWHEDRFRPLVVALSNLVMNLLLVNYWGIYGVLLSTVFATLFIGMPWLTHNLFNCVFSKSWCWSYLKYLSFYLTIVFLSLLLTGYICNFITYENQWFVLFIRSIICIIIPNIIYFIAFRKRKKEFSKCITLIKHIINGKIKFKCK